MDQEVEIRWSKKALRQVIKIGEYIAGDSPWQAERVVNLIYESPERLHLSKAIGRIVREYSNPQIRELSVYSYRIIYRIKNEALIEVVAVVHGRQILRPDMLG